MTNSREDALDLMQDVFLSVIRNLQTYRGEAAFKNWLFRIAHHRCIEFYRRRKTYVSVDELEEAACERPDPETKYFTSENNNQLVRAMANLPLSQREVIELKFFGQFTFNEIAQQLGVSSNTVKSRLYTALEKLKQTMEKDDVDS